MEYDGHASMRLKPLVEPPFALATGLRWSSAEKVVEERGMGREALVPGSQHRGHRTDPPILARPAQLRPRVGDGGRIVLQYVR